MATEQIFGSDESEKGNSWGVEAEQVSPRGTKRSAPLPLTRYRSPYHSIALLPSERLDDELAAILPYGTATAWQFTTDHLHFGHTLNDDPSAGPWLLAAALWHSLKPIALDAVGVELLPMSVPPIAGALLDDPSSALDGDARSLSRPVLRFVFLFTRRVNGDDHHVERLHPASEKEYVISLARARAGVADGTGWLSPTVILA